MVDDDRAVRERLAQLEAEVRADGEADRARREAATERVREARAKQQAEQGELRERQAAIVKRQSSSRRDDGDDLAGTLELAGKANNIRRELAKRPGKGQKSWMLSGLVSTGLGPIGWLYAGSLREAIPAATAWVLAAALVSKILPAFLLMPALFVALPLSGIAGVVYALQYNRTGGRKRLFGNSDSKTTKQLRGG